MRFWYLNPVCLAGFAWVVCRRIPGLISIYWPGKPACDIEPEYWTTTAEGLQRFAQAIREANGASGQLGALFIGVLIGSGVLVANWIASPSEEDTQNKLSAAVNCSSPTGNPQLCWDSVKKRLYDQTGIEIDKEPVGVTTRIATTRGQFDAAVGASDIGDVVSMPTGTYTSWGNVIFPDPPKGKIAFSNNVFMQRSINTVIEGKGGNEIYNNTFFACSSSECTTVER
jgi:hypothetical protein